MSDFEKLKDGINKGFYNSSISKFYSARSSKNAFRIQKY